MLALTVEVTVITLRTVAVPHALVTVYLIVSTPLAIPLTTPVEETDATVGLVLLHVPPVVESVSVMVLPGATVDAPWIEAT
jgi:hypothetical protein